ncbi:hypothetical protein [Amycolatopsis rubida]|uniref:hypothetical protein n=1 Tax=Amycolatopsis rubida TaxID=112413 RepID=UPI000B811DDE|nr:hypothetical protein [Amycolatopsis rubida]
MFEIASLEPVICGRTAGAGHDLLVKAEELVAIELADDERKVLGRGLAEWGGPAHCTEALAVAMGFRSVADLYEEGRRLHAALTAGDPLGPRDWRRMLVATEIVFASDVFGSGCDWSITTGFSDEETIKILRRLQRTIARALRGALHRHDH